MQSVRGTHDWFGDEYLLFSKVIKTCSEIASLYGYQGIATPIFEYASVFKRTLGETSDIVGKEMYTFPDRHGEELTLRPEGTAGVVRAVIQHHLLQTLPLKVFSAGPMFRYERPQKGRCRQFHQFDVEAFGDSDPWVDAECIAMSAQILQSLSIPKPTLHVNTLGDKESRQAYRTALVTYLAKYQSSLSLDSQRRSEMNPLRILDSKDSKDQEILIEAPLLKDYLTTEAGAFFENVCRVLETFDIPYVYHPKIVRGLDYYTHTVFEWISDHLGAQATVLAGGRYDGLVQQMGGPNIGGIGWALGLERVILLMEKSISKKRPVALISLGYDETVGRLATKLRSYNIYCEILKQNRLSNLLKQANRMNAQWAVIVGEEEEKEKRFLVKNLDTQEQEVIAYHEIEALIENFVGL